MEYKSNWICVAIDETRHWNLDEKQAAAIERILGVYFYDANERTHLCELTPSYYLRSLSGSIWFKDDVSDALKDEIDDATSHARHSGEDIYMHCSDVNRIDAKWKSNYGPALDYDGTEIIDTREAEEVVREYFQGNCAF